MSALEDIKRDLVSEREYHQHRDTYRDTLCAEDCSRRLEAITQLEAENAALRLGRLDDPLMAATFRPIRKELEEYKTKHRETAEALHESLERGVVWQARAVKAEAELAQAKCIRNDILNDLAAANSAKQDTESLVRELDAARKALAEASEDKSRMDWLLSAGSEFSICDFRESMCREEYDFVDSREDIDDARAAVAAAEKGGIQP